MRLDWELLGEYVTKGSYDAFGEIPCRATHITIE